MLGGLKRILCVKYLGVPCFIYSIIDPGAPYSHDSLPTRYYMNLASFYFVRCASMSHKTKPLEYL